MEIPAGATVREKYSPAIIVEDAEKADAYFAALVAHTLAAHPALTREEAEQVERVNLRTWLVRVSAEDRERVKALYRLEDTKNRMVCGPRLAAKGDDPPIGDDAATGETVG